MKRREFMKALLRTSIAAAGVMLPGIAAAPPGRPAARHSVSSSNHQRRRRRRRRVHRGARFTALPYGCSVTRRRGGRNYYYCGGIWYRPVYSGTTVVYVVDDIESGADTDVIFMEY